MSEQKKFDPLGDLFAALSGDRSKKAEVSIPQELDTPPAKKPQKGRGFNLAGLLGTAAVITGRFAVVAVARCILKKKWPGARALTLAAAVDPIPLPGPLKALLAPFAPHVIALFVLGKAIETLMPDQSRTVRLWRQLLPIWAVYMWTRFKVDPSKLAPEEVERQWDERHEWGAQQVYDMLLDLSGYYIKSAQILASKSDFMPPQWTSKLSTMFDQMPARPWREVEETIEAELRSSALHRGHVFESVQEEPIAAASIAQVHMARLSPQAIPLLDASTAAWLEGHRDVVVKVQHKGMYGLMASDLRNIGRVASFLRSVLPFDVSGIVKEIQAQIPKEFDFVRERRMMEVIRERLREAHPHVLIPRTVPQLCTARQLVLERMEGVPFTTVLPLCCEAAAKKAKDSVLQQRAAMQAANGEGHNGTAEAPVTGKASALLANGLPLTIHVRTSNGDLPHSEEDPALSPKGGLAPSELSDEVHSSPSSLMGCKAKESCEKAYKLSSTSAPFTGDREAAVAAASRAFDLLVDSMGQMLLRDGLFHGDCHPGNLLLDVSEGRIVLLDFGQCKALPAPLHRTLCQLMIAIDDEDRRGVAEGLHRLGLHFGTEDGRNADLEATFKIALVMLDLRFLPEASMSPFGDPKDNPLLGTAIASFPADIYMIVRCLMLLRGIAFTLGKDVHSARLWRRYAEEALQGDWIERRAAENAEIERTAHSGNKRAAGKK